MHDNPDAVRVPDPVPVFVAVRAYWLRVNVAVTVLLADIITVHVFPLVTLHPVQEVKPEPVFPVAVKTTDVPSLYVSVQSEPQLIPVPETEPAPVPDFDTVRIR